MYRSSAAITRHLSQAATGATSTITHALFIQSPTAVCRINKLKYMGLRVYRNGPVAMSAVAGRSGLIRDFHFGRPGLAPSTPKTFCLDRFAVAAHWACPLNRQRAVREGLAEQTAVVLGRFFDTSPTLRPVVAHGLVTPSAVNRPVRAAPRFAGASPQTAAASDGSPPAGASSNERVSPAAHPS